MSSPHPLIAVVDDDLIFTGLLRDFLDGEGYATVTWSEAEGALSLIRNEKPALVVLDIRMEQPHAGRHILELLKLDYETTAIPVIVCSADARFLVNNRAFLHAHAAAVLEKPFDLDELLATVVRLIGPAAPRTGRTIPSYRRGNRSRVGRLAAPEMYPQQHPAGCPADTPKRRGGLRCAWSVNALGGPWPASTRRGISSDNPEDRAWHSGGLVGSGEPC